MPGDPSVLAPYDRLVDVTIEGRRLQVPASNTLLRVLQYLEVDLYACRLCWNGDCEGCRTVIVHPGSRAEVAVKACATEAKSGMEIKCIPHLARWPEEPAAD